MKQCVRVAAAAVNTQPGAPDENLAKLDDWTRRAAESGADLVLFPELSLSGFVPNHPRSEHEPWLRNALLAARRSAIRLPGTQIQSVAATLGRHGILVSFGFLEDAGHLLYNTQLLVGPGGIVGAWRKMHVPMFEMPFYNGGPAVRTVDAGLARLGANICFDALLPESTRLLAVDGAEIVLMPFAADPPPTDPAGWAQWAGPAIRARAVENGVFCVAVNYVGELSFAGASQQFPGGGLIVSPRGSLLAEWQAPAGQSAMIMADLLASDLEAARAEPEFLFRFRRPELYGRLAAP